MRTSSNELLDINTSVYILYAGMASPNGSRSYNKRFSNITSLMDEEPDFLAK